jgi:hypothetical protein
MQEFANRIIAELENGVKPWVRPWDPEKAGGPQAPFNPVTGKRYHGINVLILGMDMRAFQTGDPRWMTYQQAQSKDWQVRSGRKVSNEDGRKQGRLRSGNFNSRSARISIDEVTDAGAVSGHGSEPETRSLCQSVGRRRNLAGSRL